MGLDIPRPRTVSGLVERTQAMSLILDQHVGRPRCSMAFHAVFTSQRKIPRRGAESVRFGAHGREYDGNIGTRRSLATSFPHKHMPSR